jgi:hypothetical protein
MPRRESSGSVVELSGDGSHFGTARNLSSTSSTPKKTVQSIGSRSHHQNQANPIKFGTVDEYTRTEAMVGFGTEKKRRALLSELERRSSFRGEMESDSRLHQVALISGRQSLLPNGKHSRSINGACRPILIEDIDTEEVVEVSPVAETHQGQKRKATPRPEGSNDVISQKERPHTVPSTTEISHYFAKPGKGSAAHSGTLQTASAAGSRESTVEASEGADMVSPGSSQSHGHAVDDVQYLEDDSIDLVGSDDGPADAEPKGDGKAGPRNNLMKSSAVPRSRSILQIGDIPGSALSKLQASRSQPKLTSESELSFEITYMKSGPKELTFSAEILPWKLQYDYDKKEFDIVAYVDSIRETFPGLVLKPEKIHIVKYCPSNRKVWISRATEANIGAAPQVYLEMSRADDGNRLAHTLKSLNSTIKIISTNGSAPTPPETCFSADRSNTW